MQGEGLSGPPILASNNTPPRFSQQELHDILEQYAEKIVISFMSPATLESSMGRSYGVTTFLPDPNLGGQNNGVDVVVSLFNPNFIWRLMDANESISSKTEVTLCLAMTIAHEMIHAIYRVKLMLEPPDEAYFEEPFYAPPGTEPRDSAWLNELGLSWEQSIISGAVLERPSNRISVGGLFLISEDLPNGDMGRSYGRGIDLASHDDDTWHAYALPAFVAQFYGTDEFWNNYVSKYGLRALYLPRLFRTELDRRGGGNPKIVQLEYSPAELHPALLEYGFKFTTRLNQWRLLRPWMYEKGAEWEYSPYSRWHLRAGAAQFRVAHRKGDEWIGQQCERNLGAREHWEDEFNDYGYLLDEDEDWIDQAIGYLMLVVMPIRSQRKKRRIYYFPTNEHVPGAAAVAHAASKSVKPFELVYAADDGDWDESHLELRNVPFNPYDPNCVMGTRLSLMTILRDEIPNRQRTCPLPDPVYQAVKAMFDSVDREAPQYQVSDKWLSDQISFVLPPWQSENTQKNVGYAPPFPYQPYNASAQPQQYFPGAVYDPQQDPASGPAAGPGPRTPPQQGPAVGPGPRTPARSSSGSSESSTQSNPPPTFSPLGTPGGPRRPASARLGSGRAARSARRAAMGLDEVYYTVGEVGDRLSIGNLWIIADDGANGYDVYNATDVVEEMWADDHVAFTLDDHCERTLMGLKARPRLQQNLEARAEHLGKLILPMRRHEIAERDGRYGRPLWISVGNDVFDISNFPFESDKQRDLMTKMPGGNPWKAIVKDRTIDNDQLVIDLKPYRCAVVASQVPDKGPSPNDEFHFTPKEVACHVYPETTMYTIIRGQVYNLTGYMEFHPGGVTILRQWAGRDSTQEFERFHADADRCLADYDYLRVGRVVPEKEVGQLTHNEVALNGHVYDLSRIGNGEPERAFIREIDNRGLRGQDITSVLNNDIPPPPQSLQLLPERPDLITAKLSVPLMDVDMDTLRANNGGNMPLPGGMKMPRNRIEANLQMPLWVSHDGLVYDMTAVSKWGPEDVKKWLNGHEYRYRGAVVPPSAFATRLQRDFDCRVIGRLVRKSRRPKDDGAGGGDGNDRAHQKPRLH